MGSKYSKPKKRRSSEASYSQPEKQISQVAGEIFPISCLGVWEEDVFVGKSDGVRLFLYMLRWCYHCLLSQIFV